MRNLAHLAIVVGIVAGTAEVARASYNQASATYSYAYAPTHHATLSDCDDCIATVSLPWSFPYYGRSYSSITISSNGFIVLGSYSGSSYAYNPRLGPDGTTSAPGPVIAPLWDDWNPAVGGDVFYGTSGGAFVVEWWNVKHYGQTAGSSTTFELKLFPDGRIEFHHGNLVTSNASWDSGASATVGYQEDSDTVGHGVHYNDNRLPSYAAYAFTRPGTVAVYMKAKDGFYSPARVRANLRFSQMVLCGSFSFSSLSFVTGSGEWSRGAASPCTSPALFGDVAFGGDAQGYDVATIPLSPITNIVHGTYRFVKRSDFTPSPTVAHRHTVTYGDGIARTSKLDYWQGGSAIDKTVLVVTGFDPLNESSTAQYLVLLGDLARTALAEGRDIAIGKFADGNQRISWFDGEVGTWVNDAYARSGYRKIQVAGVSMGGVVVREAAYYNTGSFSTRVAAWYSVDSPQTGANLGRGYRGIQNLILCNKSSDDPQYKQIFSNPAADMMTLRVTSCSCDDEPENSTCSWSSSYHDGYYGSIGWPTSVPRYALAFGDANPTNGYAKQGSGKLYDFEYSGLFCSEDRDWNGGQRDCNAGSRYISPDQVNTDEGASVCGTFKLRLQYNPSFINSDSALGVTTSIHSNTEDTGSCSSSYPTLAPTYWNGWASNDYNELHTVLSSSLLSQMMTWLRQHQP